MTKEVATGVFERVAVTDAYTVSNFDENLLSKDETPPGRITDVQVIDIHSGISSMLRTRNYTITWTATGDDFSSGQGDTYILILDAIYNLEFYIFKYKDNLQFYYEIYLLCLFFYLVISKYLIWYFFSLSNYVSVAIKAV